MFVTILHTNPMNRCNRIKLSHPIFCNNTDTRQAVIWSTTCRTTVAISPRYIEEEHVHQNVKTQSSSASRKSITE